jgi:hypothetical protein
MHLEDSALCLGGCGVGETIDHLVVGCDMSSCLWIKILNWLGIFGPFIECCGRSCITILQYLSRW